MATPESELTELIQRFQLLDKIYESARLVDPLKRVVVPFKTESPQSIGSCYGFWERDLPCDSCISMRAYQQDSTFFKIECLHGRTIMVTAIPVEFQGRKVVIEFLNDVTRSMIFSSESDTVRVESLVSHMNDLAVRDELTGLYNRRFINERLPADLVKSLFQQEPLSIIMVDLDHFKKLNDNYGHLAGDFALKKFCELLQSNIRKNIDWVARYGGEEFLICLHNSTEENAVRKAETIRQKLKQLEAHYYDVPLCLTASFGVCTIDNEEISLDEAIERADSKLFQAKREGRDRVCS